MSIHISASKGEIAKTVLMPGDPLRAKFIADHFLQEVKLVSSTRNAYYFTGKYGGKELSVGASGMGCPSIGIYSYELFDMYDVDCIIRVGTCGAYSGELKLFDLVNVEKACSESSFALHAFGYGEDFMLPQGNMFSLINEAARQTDQALRQAPIHSSDIFYRAKAGTPDFAVNQGCLAVEMEAFALFANARYLGKSAAALLTVSDIIPTHERMTADEREKALEAMVRLALEACLLS